MKISSAMTIDLLTVFCIGLSGVIGCGGESDSNLGSPASATDSAAIQAATGSTVTGLPACEAAYAGALVKNCTTVSDCVLVRHSDCCGTIVTGIRAGTEAVFAAAENAYQNCVPGCGLRGCYHPPKDEAGVTNAGTTKTFFVECASGRCTSVVH